VIGQVDGLELHLKEAPKYGAERRHRREHEHLDAAAGVDGIEGVLRAVPGESVLGAREIAGLTLA
jgi:hypothetical protein